MALGAGEDTIYRDRNGRKLEMLSEMMRNEAGGSGQPGPVPPVWGTGLAQQRSSAARRADERSVASKPLAQYEIDGDVDARKRAEMRWEDPMAQHLAKRSSGAPSKPKYRGPPPPPNRFDIPPGHRWDGVDRSNGYEKQFFIAQAKARRDAQEVSSSLLQRGCQLLRWHCWVQCISPRHVVLEISAGAPSDPQADMLSAVSPACPQAHAWSVSDM